jgi:hypothetical protein
MDLKETVKETGIGIESVTERREIGIGNAIKGILRG